MPIVVQRPADHPLRPAGYRPRLDLMTRFGWKDIDQVQETDKPMQFWLRGQ